MGKVSALGVCAIAAAGLMLVFLPLRTAGQGASTGIIRGHVTVITQKLFGEGEKDDRSGVVVYLEGQTGGIQPTPAPTRPQVAQHKKQFIPVILPVVKGTAVDFPNQDPFYHNVFSHSSAKNFDLGSYETGESRSVQFDQPGLVTIYCNVHSQMISYVIVLDNPFFAMTPSDGTFEIPGVPQGSYTLAAWSRWSDEIVRQPVEVKGADAAEVSVTVRETKTSLAEKHTNKFGREYKKY